MKRLRVILTLAIALFVIATGLQVASPPPAHALTLIGGMGPIGGGSVGICECCMIRGKPVCICIVWQP